MKYLSSLIFIFFISILIFFMNVNDISFVSGDKIDPFWNGVNDPVWNEYGIVKCWFSIDNKTWNESTVNYAEIKIGEPFFIKAIIKPLKELQIMTIRLSGLGLIPDFEVIDGPSNFEDTYLIRDPEFNKIYEFVWKFRVKYNTTWVNANSPITMDSCFIMEDVFCLPPFTVVNIFIIDEIWENYDKNIQNEDVNSSDYDIIFIFIFICFIIFIKKSKNLIK